VSVDFIPRSKVVRPDWGKRTTVYHPPIPTEDVKRIQASRSKPVLDPFAIRNRGLRQKDHLLIDWVVGQDSQLSGCRVAAYCNYHKQPQLLKWAVGFFSREPSGEYLFAPYLTSLSFVDSFADMLATACGCTATVLDSGVKTRRRFVLEKAVGENQRLVQGDILWFDRTNKSLCVERPSLDMNLFGSPDRILSRFDVGYISAPHHPDGIARQLAEANCLWVKPIGGDAFEVISPS